jgi:hypothetical protein
MERLTGAFGKCPGIILRAALILCLGLSLAQAVPVAAAETRLVASDNALDDHFGASVSIDGNLAVVGAYAKDNYIGAAYVFSRSAGAWVQQAKLMASDDAPGDNFGWAVAISGDTAVVGAYGHNGERGAVYVFTRSGSTWTEQAKLTASDSEAVDRFGYSVAISGDTIVVGAYGKGSLSGAAYVFTRSAGAWSQQAKLVASDGATGDWFGYSVAVHSETAVVGALYKNSGAGAAYVFTRSGSAWSQQTKLIASDGASGDNLGCSVSINGDSIVAGARGRSFSTGAAYVFIRSSGLWSEQTRLTAGDGSVNNRFGVSVAISVNAVIVGAEGIFNNTGVAYTFLYSNGAWLQQDRITASDSARGDYFGCTVSISGDTAAVGARDKSSYKGAAYVYSGVIPLAVTTFEASDITATQATLNGGLISLGAADSVEVYFEYGLTVSYGNSTQKQALAAAGPFSIVVGGLEPNTRYHFRARVGSYAGPDATFTTLPAAEVLPTVTTSGVSSVTATSAILRGNLTSLGSASSLEVYFEYGLTADYGSATSHQTVSAAGPFSASASGLEPGQVYHFRAVAGGVKGLDMLFTTPEQPVVEPQVSTSGAGSITSSGATLSGSLINMGSSASVNVYFEYGLNTSYGHATSPQAMSAAGAFSASLTNLEPGLTYHFRAVAQGDSGAVYGQDATFQLTAPPATTTSTTGDDNGQGFFARLFSPPWLWVWLGVVVLALAGAAAAVLMNRRRSDAGRGAGASRYEAGNAPEEPAEGGQVNVIAALSHLDEQRRQGAISNEEYEARRAEIIKRITKSPP